MPTSLLNILYKGERTFASLLAAENPPLTVYEHEESVVDGVTYRWVHHLIRLPDGRAAYSTGVEACGLTIARSEFLTVLEKRQRSKSICGDEQEPQSK